MRRRKGSLGARVIGHDDRSVVDDHIFKEKIEPNHDDVKTAYGKYLTVDLQQTSSLDQLHQSRYRENEARQNRRNAEPIRDIVPEHIHPEQVKDELIEVRQSDACPSATIRFLL